MAEATHFLDFLERLEQLYEMEAVKEAYLAYVSSMFSAYQVFKTPPALARGGVQLSESSGIRASPRLLSPSEESMHDELILIVGRRGALGHELARWLEKPRAAVLSRLERLLLKPPEVIGEDLASQRALHHTLRALAQEKSRPFVSLLVEVGNISGLGPVLGSSLPPRGRVFTFTNSVLAAVIPDCDDLRARWLVHRAVTALDWVLTELEAPERPVTSVACWPTDARTVPMLVLALQQGLQDACRMGGVQGQNARTTLFASEWVAHGQQREEPGEDGSAGAPVRVPGAGPDLRGGSARRLDDEEPH